MFHLLKDVAALAASLFLLKAQDFVNKVTGVLDPYSRHVSLARHQPSVGLGLSSFKPDPSQAGSSSYRCGFITTPSAF
jgi:hypothetical protein